MAKQQPAFALAVEDSSGSLLSDVVVEASTIQDLRGALAARFCPGGAPLGMIEVFDADFEEFVKLTDLTLLSDEVSRVRITDTPEPAPPTLPTAPPPPQPPPPPPLLQQQQ